MPRQDAARYEVAIAPLASITELAQQWHALEQRVQPAAFLRWHWIHSWLTSYSPSPLVVHVHSGGELVALGLVVVRQETRRGLLRSRVAYLHQTGDPRQDQIWVEYNGLLAAPDHHAPALSACARALLFQGFADELRLSMVEANSAPTGLRVDQTVRGYASNLAQRRAAGQDVLQGLSANTRYQIRRALRGFAQRYGEPALQVAASPEEALQMFQEAGQWHRQRWHDSGFNNPAFTDFHEQLIKRGVDHNTVSLLRVSAGDHVVGVFFYLLAGRTVHFYLQGVAPEANGKLKPGLMSHALLMQHFLELGFDVYDFMGGESQYKQQLADTTTHFMMLHQHNGHWRFRLEDLARRLRRRLRS